MISFKIQKKEKLLKALLNELTGVSYATACKLLRQKDVKVNGKRVSRNVDLKIGDSVEVYIQENQIKKVYVELFNDDNVLVVKKESGYTSDALFELLLKDCKEVYYIHRLDRNTSGVMIFAKNKMAEEELIKGFKNRTFKKLYKAEVFGVPEKQSDVLKAYLFKDAKMGKVFIRDGKKEGYTEIITSYRTLSSNEKTSTLLVELITGKTHQIRAHLAHIGHPIIGDGKYGDDRINAQFNAKKQMLTAYSLTLYFNKNSPLAYLNGREFLFRG